LFGWLSRSLWARMDVRELKNKLDTCLNGKQPVIAVVAVIGSTEESNLAYGSTRKSSRTWATMRLLASK
jgi:hypothetical protein